ncbi:MAG: carboxylating nicotinate-nucleotide diphosphorylase [Candidatus Hodarchaeales archaeon]
MSYMPDKLLEKKLLDYLQEDISFGDITTSLVPSKKILANVIAKEDCIICGIKFVKILFNSLNIQTVTDFQDGDFVSKNQVVLNLEGKSRDILVAERTALNLLMHLSGIATQTHRLVEIIKRKGLNISIAATRKCIPGIRYFQKYAVSIGGGDFHRFSLSDAILIKENHLKMFTDDKINQILLEAKRKTSFTKKIEIEVENLSEFKTVLSYQPDIIMLDDFSIQDIKKAISILSKSSNISHPLIEVSGGISLHNIQDYLIPGIDIISIGSLTHSSKAIDISLKIV